MKGVRAHYSLVILLLYTETNYYFGKGGTWKSIRTNGEKITHETANHFLAVGGAQKRAKLEHVCDQKEVALQNFRVLSMLLLQL